MAKRSAKNRPPPLPFDIDRIKDLGAETSTDGDFIICEGQRFRRGLLYKVFPLNAVTNTGVNPNIDELRFFQDKPTTDPDFLRELSRAKITDNLYTFAPGDYVEVAEGELINLKGKVKSVDKNEVIIIPEHRELNENLKFNASELRKCFKQGHHVRIIGGAHEGLTGSVVKVEDQLVVVVSDLNYDEYKVRPHNLKLDTNVSSGVDQLGQYQFHDMVALDPNTVGVIIRLEREFTDVLSQTGKVVRVRSVSIQLKHNANKGRTMDSLGNTVQKGDLVKVSDSFKMVSICYYVVIVSVYSK